MIIKSKTILLVSVVLAVFLLNLTAFAVPPKRNPLPSDYHTGISWEKAVKNKDTPMVVNFYVDWCNACRKFAPNFERLRKEYGLKYNFVIVKTDDPKNEELVKQYRINSFPSMYIIDKKEDKEIFVDQRKYFNINELRRELSTFLEQKSD